MVGCADALVTTSPALPGTHLHEPAEDITRVILTDRFYPGNIWTGEGAVDHMDDHRSIRCTAFEGHRLLASGALPDVARKVKAAVEGGSHVPVLVFDDATGRVIDLDLRGSEADVAARLGPHRQDANPGTTRGGGAEAGVTGRRGPGRPRLGVVAREVTLLPRHWEWLGAQPGGASAALRRLVDDARRTSAPLQARRRAREAAYRFMLAVGGDLPGYEEATRALFKDDVPGFAERIAAWPEDVRAHALRLAFPDAKAPDDEERASRPEDLP